MLIDIHTHNPVITENTIAIENILLHQSFDLLLGHSYSVGLHPWYLHEANGQNLELLEKYLQNSQVIAIGEAGLDKAIDTDFQLQTDIFIQQIQLSEQYKKPLIIHCVRAYQDIIALKKQTKALEPWIIHGFAGNLQTADMLLKHGCRLGFGEMLWKNEKVQSVFKEIPLDKILLETDVSAKTVEEVYQKGALLRKIETSVLEKQIWNNFAGIFPELKFDAV